MSFDVDALDDAARLIGDRWSLRVVATLLERPSTFSELSASITGIAPNVLTARLRQLEHDGLVVATPYAKRPVRMRYGLTATGHDLAPALAVLADWGARRLGRQSGRHHEACGTSVELRPWCPTCERIVDPDDTTDVAWA